MKDGFTTRNRNFPAVFELSAKIFQIQFIFGRGLVDRKDRLWVFGLMVEQPV
jgi:hypothetical protein